MNTQPSLPSNLTPRGPAVEPINFTPLAKVLVKV
jgi:hypothetical protein